MPSTSSRHRRLLEDASAPRIHARQVRRHRWAWRLSWQLPLLFVAVVALWAYGATTTWSARWTALGSMLLVAAAAMAVGGLLGFLFGVPKVLSEGGGTDTAAEPGAPPAVQGTVTNAVRGGVTANTNLEQISDWLTKILVGVGLVQLGRAPDAFGRLVGNLTDAFGMPAGAHVIGSVLVAFAVVGFLDAYLLTRLALTGAFDDVESRARVQDDPQEVLDEP